jgi:tetratricopeptide (TPR) repeat protein
MYFFRYVVVALGLSCVMAVAHAMPATPAGSDDVPALAVAEANAKAHAADADAWITVARARINAGKAEKAIDAARKATKLAPRNAEAYYWLGNAYGNHMGDVGMLGKMRMAPKLRDAFERTVALDPGHVKARSSLIEYYLLAPSVIGGGVDKARAQALQIGKRDKARGLLAQARIAGYEKQQAEALKLYQAAIAARPDDADIQYPVAMAYVQAERWGDAMPLLRRMATQKQYQAAALYQMGRCAALSGQFLDEGGAALQRYLALPQERGNPESKHAWYRLGQVQAKAGHPDQARASWQRALKLDPGFDEAKAELSKMPAR